MVIIVINIIIDFRDLEYLWSVILMLIMYTCAIFYKPEKIIEKHYGWILDINPLYSIIINFRNSIFGLPIDMKAFLISIIFSLVSLLIGIFLFYHKQDKFILHI
ncbi:ABC transporter permease [Anaerocolumna sp. AGMB13025]|uniref:ABC transporter permease n=1 Tax=Anaerocolumna sp. AGMB13025 TaxID=3039116 RepID=UPI00241D05B8|nr:ABC transporter permease [Anaerocolumna sp. AGMB13025]WFR60269.1 ABC transporter permease [Anaerocolumna sp. AGMB13025]